MSGFASPPTRPRAASIELSVVMPMYNEEENVGRALGVVEDVLRRMDLSYEIVVVDDGSVDRTRLVAQGCAEGNDHIKVVSYGRNMGKGYALKTGFMCSGGEKIVFLDGDLEVAPHFGVYVKALDHFDVVVGSKMHPRSRVRAPTLRKILSLGFHFAVMLLMGVRVSDTQAGLKAFRREALGRILRMNLVKRHAFDVELMALASLLRLRVSELPVEIRLKGMFSLRGVLYMLVDLMGMVYRMRILRWYQRNLGEEEPTYKPIIPL
ncbi:MAG: glycosyltransferase [Candidatus Geothermarchaeales archaeon]